MKFHYTDPEMFFKDKNNITVKEIQQLMCAMTHCTSSCYYHEWFSKAMYELCPESYGTVEKFLRGWSKRPQATYHEIMAEGDAQWAEPEGGVMRTSVDDMARLFKLPWMPQADQQDFKRYEEFISSVGCLIAEGSEFMTKEQLYDAIKNVFNRIILRVGDKDCD